MTDSLPSITIDDFVVEMPRRLHAPRPSITTEPGRIVSAIARLHRRYESTIGCYRSFSPRHESRVEHRVDSNPFDLVRAVGLPFRYDSIAHEHRAPSWLRLGWSWPPLPVWLAVSETSSRQSVISVRLRSRKRWRYPRRYYAAAHAMLTAIRSD